LRHLVEVVVRLKWYLKTKMSKIVLEIGKTYKDRSGRLIKITGGLPPIDGKRDGWDGIYWGDSVDGKEPKIKKERYTFEGKQWSYISGFSMFGYQELNDIEKDLIEQR
jgi:hypothetical protein